MRDLLSDYDRLATQGRPVGRAVVTSVWGSAPRPEGSSMLATADGTMAGSVSGGCVEGATATEIGEAIGRGTPKLVTFGVTHERAWEVGLACGGTIKVFVEPEVRPEVLAAARGPGGEVVATMLDGARPGATLRIFEDGRTEGTLGEVPLAPVRDAALAALRREASATTTVESAAGPASVFLEVFARRPRLVIFGGVHIAVALVPLARALGLPHHRRWRLVPPVEFTVSHLVPASLQARHDHPAARPDRQHVILSPVRDEDPRRPDPPRGNEEPR